MPFLVPSLIIILKYSGYKIKLFCKHKTEKRPTNRVDNMMLQLFSKFRHHVKK